MNSSTPKKSIVLDTTTGAIGIELYWDHCPKTCQNFYDLVITIKFMIRPRGVIIMELYFIESLLIL